MPNETKQAVNWALLQKDSAGNYINKDTPHELVDKVREYFNSNSVSYDSFSYDDLIPFLQ